MSSRDEVRDYLKIRTERIKRENPHLKKKLEELQKKIDRAVQEPSEKCIDNNEHNFVFISHADTREEAIYYFCCDKCDEVVVTKQIRAADDPMRY